MTWAMVFFMLFVLSKGFRGLVLLVGIGLWVLSIASQ